MRTYYLKRLSMGALLIFSVSILVFSMMHMMPGDPIDLMVDRRVSQDRRDALRKEYGLDRPLITQYVDWAGKILLHGDFGIAIRTKQPVNDQLSRRIPISLKLCGLMFLFELIIAVPLGLICAYKKDSWIDRIITNISLVMTAVPNFWLCVILIIIFSVKLKWLPISGYEQARNWVLPVASGVLGGVSGTIRLTRSETIDAMRQKYVVTAYAKGLPHRAVVVGHVLRNALILITVLMCMSIPWLISGAVITERMFGIPGMGHLLINSIVMQDYSVVQACVLIITTLTVAFNILGDILIGLLDPRIRIAQTEGAQ
ncbi:MAG: ABC transporter permease [Oscillospiraceae bacterium]|nr:ABC transporter permease [Oscillospiraceae bacterium]